MFQFFLYLLHVSSGARPDLNVRPERKQTYIIKSKQNSVGLHPDWTRIYIYIYCLKEVLLRFVVASTFGVFSQFLFISTCFMLQA